MPKFCPNCKSIIFLKKDKNDNKRSFCNRCGFLDNIKIDENEYKIKSDLGQQHETVIIDRQKQIKELTEKYGKRTYGSSCLNCKSFYLTKHLMSTRGDEPGKTIWFCLNCGHSFRRPNYVQKVGIDKPLSLDEK
ncbi:MAG: hypothetical protein HeimC3_28470 [Candidatus Heimdallarchaeota archaeon LC_3]|nr:MAG: hypothetical protein HeimC3_28470 [Candidatus Heimdallarchaeota archaeon LC_3]